MPEAMYFGKLQRLFFDHYNRGNYQQALAFLEENANTVPAYKAITMAWRVGMHCLTGDGAGGIRLLEEACADGIWYHEEALANDDDYALLRDDPAFQDLLKRFRELRLAQQMELVPHLSILEPPANMPQPWPLLITLHGNIGNASQFSPYFRPAAKQGWLVAVPQSFDTTWVSGYYDWRDYNSACHHIQNQIGILKTRYDIDSSRTVLAGFSMGGQIALQAALAGDIPALGFIGLEGWIFDEELFQRLLQTTLRLDLRVYLVAGNSSDYCDKALKIQEQLLSSGIACELEVASNKYHGIPLELDQVLDRAFRYICEG